MTLGIAALLALALATSAGAAQYEPNDTRDTAYGPLEGGKTYTAEIETENDVDWYLFYVKTYSQLDFSSTIVKSSGCRAIFQLYDKDGAELNGSDSFVSGEVNETRHFYLTMNPGRYYLEVRACDPKDQYSFKIDPAASLTTSRECGEAIVAKDAIVPILAKLSEELAENGEELGVKAAAVKKAKKVLRKLKKRRNVSRWTRRDARRKLDQAIRARTAVWNVRRDLETLNTQQQGALAATDGQLATYC